MKLLSLETLAERDCLHNAFKSRHLNSNSYLYQFSIFFFFFYNLLRALIFLYFQRLGLKTAGNDQNFSNLLHPNLVLTFYSLLNVDHIYFNMY